MIEAPEQINELGLFVRLHQYANGDASWSDQPLTRSTRDRCSTLYGNLLEFAKRSSPLLNKINDREFGAFTLHDERHALKVAHLMWAILSESRRSTLTPPEIAIMIASAYFHDLGLLLAPDERESLLSSRSPMWNEIVADDALVQRREALQRRANEGDHDAHRALVHFEEAILCEYLRATHATRRRYLEIVEKLEKAKLPVSQLLVYGDDSLEDITIDVCVSHGDPPESLAARSRHDPSQMRFPREAPYGSALADTRLCAAALRIADILDFDRERTPSILFHYMLAADDDAEANRSVLEWCKHLSVAHWKLEKEAIVYRTRCTDPAVHKATLDFCEDITHELSNTRQALCDREAPAWPFAIPSVAKASITSIGYHYVPFRLKLDEDRIYTLLMGQAIYDDPLDALRELIQNAVDACRFRDALIEHHHGATAQTTDRIFIILESQPDQPLSLVIRDTGTGMDEYLIREYLLKVGKSYYSSTEFNRRRMALRQTDNDLAPISEFGIGFLSSFMLGDQITVTTAMWPDVRNGSDTHKRIVQINGLTRLIHLQEDSNIGESRYSGTEVKLRLRPDIASSLTADMFWKRLLKYLRRICVELPYTITLEKRLHQDDVEVELIEPSTLRIEIPDSVRDAAVVIPVNHSSGLTGEIALVCPSVARVYDEVEAKTSPVSEDAGSLAPENRQRSALIRGGFALGHVPGLPRSFKSDWCSQAIIRLQWQNTRDRRYPKTNLARTGVHDDGPVTSAVFESWLSWLLENLRQFPRGLTSWFSVSPPIQGQRWTFLEKWTAYDIYLLASDGWHSLYDKRKDEDIIRWENGQGPAIWVGPFRDMLHALLLRLVLPRVSLLQMGNEASFFWQPPAPGWKEQLRSWRTFVSEPIPDSPFVQYVGEIEKLLYFEYNGSTQLNRRYEEDLRKVFDISEIVDLRLAIMRLAKGILSPLPRRTSLSFRQCELLRRLQQQFGGAEIGSIHKVVPIAEVNLRDGIGG